VNPEIRTIDDPLPRMPKVPETLAPISTASSSLLVYTGVPEPTIDPVRTSIREITRRSIPLVLSKLSRSRHHTITAPDGGAVNATPNPDPTALVEVTLTVVVLRFHTVLPAAFAVGPSTSSPPRRANTFTSWPASTSTPATI